MASHLPLVKFQLAWRGKFWLKALVILSEDQYIRLKAEVARDVLIFVFCIENHKEKPTSMRF